MPTNAVTDRNLLFGILALQMDFIPKDALIQAMQTWVFDKSKPLADILVAQGALGSARRTLLDALVEEHLKQHDHDAQKSLAALSSIGSAKKDLQGIGDADVQASLVQVSANHVADAFATRVTTVGEATSAGTRFRILRPHARGGLGEVFVAEDAELHREVALKEIQGRHADQPDSRARFVLEAEITGGLEHPGIVPVYGLGQYADGRPFYAMRFIRGGSLKDAIARYHGQAHGPRPVGDPGARSVQFRQLLGRFLDVCNAIAYAHSRGVLHRDLKPGNVMLGKYGETLVVDWGLAKSMGSKDSSPTEEAPLQPSLSSGTAETLAGSAIGTPQFMSPEQAAGRLDLLGPGSDVYSLGATLYVLLTGKPPFTDADVGAVLQQVQRGEFPPPRQVQHDVPQALAAICLKAMALQPADRYATPRALADDIEKWLADEAVSAFREPALARLGRWARRHRTAVTAAAASLLVAVVGLVTATALLTAANERERAAKGLAQQNEEEATKQRDKARSRFQLARDAVDKFHTQVSESPEMKAQGVEKLRRKLLESAVQFYQMLAQEEEGSDPDVQKERGSTLLRLGDLCVAIGRYEQAEQAFREALASRTKLAADHASATYQSDLAAALNSLGNLYSDTGRNADAEKAHQEALAILKKLAAADPAVDDYQNGLASSLNNLGLLYSATGRHADAEKAQQDALVIRKKLAADHPTVTRYQDQLAVNHNNLGVLYGATGRPADAEKAHLDALTIRKKLVADHPTVTGFQSNLAASCNNLGNVYRATGRGGEAEKAYQEALVIRKKLAAEHATVTEFQGDLAASHNNLGSLYRNSGRNTDAEKAHQEALVIRRKLAADYPGVTQYQSDLATSHNSLGNVYWRTGRPADAERAYRDALVIYQKLVADHPTVAEHQSDLAGCHSNLGILYAATDRNADAEKAYREALAVRRKLATDQPTVSEYQNVLAVSQLNLAIWYSDAGRHADAEKAFNEALAIWKKLVAENPQVLDYATNLGRGYVNLGALLRDTERFDAALTAYKQAIELLQRVHAKDRSLVTVRTNLRIAHTARANVLGTLGRHADAVRDWDRALELDTGPLRTSLRCIAPSAWQRPGTTARLSSRSTSSLPASFRQRTSTTWPALAPAPRRRSGETPLPEAERAKSAEETAARAVDFLAKADAADYFKDPENLAGMKKDPDLEPLRARADFKKLLAELVKKKAKVADKPME